MPTIDPISFPTSLFAKKIIVDPENWTAIRPSTRMVKRRIQHGDKEESYERIQSEGGIGGIKEPCKNNLHSSATNPSSTGASVAPSIGFANGASPRSRRPDLSLAFAR